MASTINNLKVKGQPAPKNSTGVAPISATFRINRPGTNLLSLDRTYQFVLKGNDTNSEMVVNGLPYQSVSSRKMEHLSRVRTANFGISTMDSSFTANCEQEPSFVIDKPHFVLCGLPVGSKDIDHHLYVNETRVGNFKTSAKALYEARRGTRSGKAVSEPAPPNDVKEYYNSPEVGTHAVPPMPPTTPINYAHLFKAKNAFMPRSSQEQQQGEKVSGEVVNAEWDNNNSNELLVKHKKMNLLRREQTSDSLDLQREHSSVSTRSVRSIETVKDSVVNNSLTVTTGKRGKFSGHAIVNNAGKVNYNNPYRNTKYKERMALSGNNRIEFNSVDSYLNYQKQQTKNGKHFMTPRAILKIPKPCSDSFLLQMMYELNRPKSRRIGSRKYSDVAMTHDLEEFVQTRTSSALSKTQSNIDKFMGARKSAKSSKSAKSFKSVLDTDTIEEESNWDGMLNDDKSVEDKI